MNTSIFIQHEACPRCQSKGHDRSGNNLGVYSDGHKHCFSCHYYEPPTLRDRIRNMAVNPVVKADEDLNFPSDYTTDIPKNGLEWLKKYGISNGEIASNHIGYSCSRNMLIFPVFGDTNELIMWQGRNFGDSGPKYLTKGKVSDIIHLVGGGKVGTVIVSEDLLSAIKIGRFYQSMPLWGSHMPLKTIQRLARRFSVLGIWLDPDKKTEALKIGIRASQYIPTFVVDSLHDPKDYDSTTMHEIIKAYGRRTFEEVPTDTHVYDKTEDGRPLLSGE